jgi:hypothetical protein
MKQLFFKWIKEKEQNTKTHSLDVLPLWLMQTNKKEEEEVIQDGRTRHKVSTRHN